jgi:hypothetical protein
MRNVPRYQFAILMLLLVLVNVSAGLMTKKDTGAAGWLLLPWAITVVIMSLGFAIIGKLPVSVGGKPPTIDWRCVIIDQRNRISLSRLQLVLWTVLVISAAITEGMLNAVWGRGQPLALNIPKELWILLGLSTASFVAAPLVLDSKADKGSLDTKPPGGHAWRDIFYGDDTGNADQVDFSKVQQFFFTILLVSVYAVAIGSVVMTTVPSSQTLLTFPPLDPGFIGIMAVSQVAYIAYKALPQNKTDAQS